MAFRRASLASLASLRPSASMRVLPVSSLVSGALQVGQRLAKPGLSGFNSNSSPHTMQVLIGNAIALPSYDCRMWMWSEAAIRRAMVQVLKEARIANGIAELYYSLHIC